MVHCVAFGCNNRSENGNKGFFLFPKDVSLRQKWIHSMKSMREVNGKIVDFVPTNTSRLCMRHFTDDCFVHSPSVMKSVGLELKLLLKKDAVPSVFAECKREIENRKPLSVSVLGPAKRKRTNYGGLEKRNRKQVVDSLISQYDTECATAAAAAAGCTDTSFDNQGEHQPDVSSMEYISARYVSRAAQTTEAITIRPTVDRCTQVQPKTADSGAWVTPSMKDTCCGPEETTSADKMFQFPEEPRYKDEEEDPPEPEFEDDVESDPDWFPTEDDLAQDQDEHEEDDENYTAWHACNNETTDPAKESKYIVFESCLLQLFTICHVCFALCKSVKKKLIGSMIVVESECETGHRRTWYSQPSLKMAPIGNLLAAGAIVFSGVSPAKVLRFFQFTNISMIKARTFSRYQKSFVLPAISNVWKRQQLANLEECQGRNVRVGGDARCCTPGHNAKFGSYTLMDLETGLVLATELIQSNEVKNSNAMELEGLKRALDTLESHGVHITDITTDRHVQVRKYLRENRPDIHHWFDSWHLAKSIKTKLKTLGKKKGCEAVSQWSQSIANHMYYSAGSSKGDGELTAQKWLSVINHVTNIHEGHGDRFNKCEHGPIEREWIKAGSKAHKELKLLLGNTRLVNDVKKLSPVDQTSELEAHHKVVCQFAPKFVNFSYAAMNERNHLAALHTSCNAGRSQARTLEGKWRFRVSYPKYKAGDHVVKPIMEEANYDYVDDLMKELLQLRKRHNSHKSAQEDANQMYANLPMPLSHSSKKVDKEEAVLAHKSRFGLIFKVKSPGHT